MKKIHKALKLSRETLVYLDEQSAQLVVGEATGGGSCTRCSCELVCSIRCY